MLHSTPSLFIHECPRPFVRTTAIDHYTYFAANALQKVYFFYFSLFRVTTEVFHLKLFHRQVKGSPFDE